MNSLSSTRVPGEIFLHFVDCGYPYLINNIDTIQVINTCGTTEKGKRQRHNEMVAIL